jgi:hypothetical protein
MVVGDAQSDERAGVLTKPIHNAVLVKMSPADEVRAILLSVCH